MVERRGIGSGIEPFGIFRSFRRYSGIRSVTLSYELEARGRGDQDQDQEREREGEGKERVGKRRVWPLNGSVWVATCF